MSHSPESVRTDAEPTTAPRAKALHGIVSAAAAAAIVASLLTASVLTRTPAAAAPHASASRAPASVASPETSVPEASTIFNGETSPVETSAPTS